jgi:hypothetical protein
VKNQQADYAPSNTPQYSSGKIRHGFTTFWLIFLLVLSGVLMLIGLVLASGYEYNIFTPINAICSLAEIAGIILVLKWKRLGIWIYIGSDLISWIAEPPIESIGLSIAIELVIYLVSIIAFILRKNGKNLWEQLG